MSLTVGLLRGVADAVQEQAVKLEEGSDEWAFYQDTADALNDLADHIAEQERG